MEAYYQDKEAGIVIYCGDTLEILPQLEPKCVNKCLTDPPYNAKNIGVYSRHYKQGAQIPESEYIEWCAQWFTMVQRITPDIMFTPGIRHMFNYPPARWVLCWHKPGAVSYNALGGFNIWEPVLLYGKCGRFTEDYFSSPPLNLIRGIEHKHPCPKNPYLWSWLIRFGTKPGDVVLDPFAGSGTTGVSCKKLGRKAILIEQVPEYCEIAVKRLAQTVMPLEIPEPKPLQLAMTQNPMTGGE